MREIKFRAWEKEGAFKGSKPKMINDLHVTLNNGSINNVLNNINYIFMQYIGLKDKNGKEIFEDDIVNIWHIHGAEEGDEHIASTCMVFYRDESAAFCLKDHVEKADYPIDVAGKANHIIEVIGNVWENEELLKWL